MKDTAKERPAPLEYASPPPPRGLAFWFSRFITRLSRPMPLAMYYMIMFVLSIIALVLAVVIRIIVKAFES